MIGIAVSTGYLLIALLVAVATLFLQLKRIRSEEAILAGYFPEYAAYRARSKKLIPLYCDLACFWFLPLPVPEVCVSA